MRRLTLTEFDLPSIRWLVNAERLPKPAFSTPISELFSMTHTLGAIRVTRYGSAGPRKPCVPICDTDRDLTLWVKLNDLGELKGY